MSLGNVGSNDASIRGVQSTQAAGVGQEQQVKEKPLDQQAHAVGLQVFKSMNAEMADIKENREVSLHAGASPPDASCRHLKEITQKFVALEHAFQATDMAGSAKAPVQSEAGVRMQDKLGASQLPNTLSVVAGAVESGKLDAQEAALMLNFGKHQLSQYQNWGTNVKNFLKESEARLPNATSAQQKASIEGHISQAKDVLGKIEQQTQALGKEVGSLEKGITSKFGKEGLNVATPPLPKGGSQVYRLTRIN